MYRKTLILSILAALCAAFGPVRSVAASQARLSVRGGGASSAVPGLPTSAISAGGSLTRDLGSLAAPLAGSAYYETLLERQRAGEVLDLSRVTRPGIAVVSDGRLSLAQGSGRFESLRAGEAMDLFVPQDQALPPGVAVVARDVPGELALKANLLSSRGEAGSNPVFVGLLTEGRTFVRVLAPRETIDAPLSRAAYEVERLRAFLADQARGWGEGSRAIDDLLSDPAFNDLSLKSRWQTLERLAAAVPAQDIAAKAPFETLRPRSADADALLPPETVRDLPEGLQGLTRERDLRGILEAVREVKGDEDVAALAAADALLQAVKAALERTYLSGLRPDPQDRLRSEASAAAARRSGRGLLADFVTELQQGPTCVMHALLNALRLTGRIALQVTPEQFVAHGRKLLDDPSKGRDRGLQEEDLAALAQGLGLPLDSQPAPAGEAGLLRLLGRGAPVLAVFDYYKKDGAALHGYAGVSHAVLIQYAFYSRSERAWVYAAADSGLGATTFYRWSSLKDLLARVHLLDLPRPGLSARIGLKALSLLRAVRDWIAGLFHDPGVGVPFRPGQPSGSYQLGVNPRTLKPRKGSAGLDERRLLAVAEHARGQAVEVSQSGFILDGHHRAAVAIREGRPVDVVVATGLMPGEAEPPVLPIGSAASAQSH
jgi:hypothetical protein